MKGGNDMTGKEQIEKELGRLRGMLKNAMSVDPVDVAVIEALGSTEVQELLLPILDGGAYLTGVVLDAAGTMVGVAHLTFECAWQPDKSHLTPAPRVAALVEVEPPRVLKAATIAVPDSPPGVRFTPPSSPVPPVLREMSIPSPSEALSFNIEANRAFLEWAYRKGLYTRLGLDATERMMQPTPIFETRDGGGGGAMGLTTGTKCTSLLCFERTSDDFDRP